MSEPRPDPAAGAARSSADTVSASERNLVCVITGATRGIGRATALGLARLGADVVLVGRDERRLGDVRDEVRRAAGGDRGHIVRADFASLASVRGAAAEISSRWPAVHVLINNAGMNSARRALSEDGHELTFAVNHLAPFLLTSLLVPALQRGAPSRVVTLSSVFAHLGRIAFGDVQSARRYDATRAYNQSKLANVMFTLDLAERLRGTGVTANCVLPGLVATDLMREYWWFRMDWLRPLWQRLLLTPEQAAARCVRVASSPALAGVTGQCFASSDHPVSAPRRARDAHARARLWDLSARLTAPADSASVAGAAR